MSWPKVLKWIKICENWPFQILEGEMGSTIV